MGLLSKGTGKDLPSVSRRLERVEMFLAGFQRNTIISEVRGLGIRAVDVLASVYGKKPGSGLPALYLTGGTAPNKVQVTPGYVNGEIPTLSGTSLFAEVPPELTIGGATDVWVKVVGTFGSPADTYVVTIETSEPTSSITGTGFVSGRLLGTVELESGAAVITHIHTGGNLGVESFGSVNLWWKL